jgi:antitoxin YefM
MLSVWQAFSCFSSVCRTSSFGGFWPDTLSGPFYFRMQKSSKVPHRIKHCAMICTMLAEGSTMDALTYSYTRQHFAEVMRQVNEDHAPVVVTSQRSKPVIIMSLDDYQALEETAYLLRHPKGAQRLMEAVEELRKGGGEFRELASDD